MSSQSRGELCDRLLCALIGLARAEADNERVRDDAAAVMLEGLYMISDECGASCDEIEAQITKTHEEKHRSAPSCSVCTSPCGRTADYDIAKLHNAEPRVEALRQCIIANLCELAVRMHGRTADDKVGDLICTMLFELGYIETADKLAESANKLGKCLIND